MKKRILFVCLGNICRSPAAQAIMEKMLKDLHLENDFEIDSAGLYGGHAGELPDKRMRQHALRRGYLLEHRSRPVKSSDFEDFDYIICMDDSNFYRLQQLSPTLETERKITRMIDYVRGFPQYHYLPDPYYEGAEGFELVLDLLEDGCRNLIQSIQKNR